MRGIRNTDKNTRKFITISDLDLWGKIDEIMTLPEYQKSFNRVINDALFVGIPQLHASLFGTATQDEQIKPKPIDDIPDEFMLKIVRLLREVIVNANINKAVLCSLFHATEKELEGTAIGKQFSKGDFQFTPDFLHNYEIRELVKLRDLKEL